MFHTILVFLCLSFSHPIHISLTEMEIEEATSKIEMSLRVFTDDLELEISLQEARRLSLDESPTETLKPSLETYANNKMIIKNGSSLCSLNLLGYEQEDDATWIYLEADLTHSIKELEITYSVLFDIYDDQTNFLKLTRGGELKTYTFSKNRHTQIVH